MQWGTVKWGQHKLSHPPILAAEGFLHLEWRWKQSELISEPWRRTEQLSFTAMQRRRDIWRRKGADKGSAHMVDRSSDFLLARRTGLSRAGHYYINRYIAPNGHPRAIPCIVCSGLARPAPLLSAILLAQLTVGSRTHLCNRDEGREFNLSSSRLF